jgi:tRNA dimethylallyltransferase
MARISIKPTGQVVCARRVKNLNATVINSCKNSTDEPPVVCLMGPTASGKTALACELYDTGKFEIISVDSALIYRDMNIGTAKPTLEELVQYPHHLVDIIDPTQVYSAAQFVEDATQLITEIHQRGKIPLLVGGTMLYFRSLLEGMADNLPSANAEIRLQIEQEAADLGWDYIHQQLRNIDPRAAERFLPSDKQRVLRALEVFRITGRAITELHDEQHKGLNEQFNFQIHALMPERSWLHDRISQRLDLMWEIGFYDEVLHLRDKYQLTSDLPSMRTVGYRQVWDFLENRDGSLISLQNMKDKALFATRQLAKRQYTWIRSLRETHAFNIYNSMNEGILGLRIRYR